MGEQKNSTKASDSSLVVKAPDSSSIEQVIVHPLVLLSVVDHYNRVAKDTDKRVVGILLGESFKGKVDITNSYAVPFEEDKKMKDIWYLDHNYHEEMLAMFKKVNAKEKVVGWYSTGPKLSANDIDIHEVVRNYTAEPLLVIIDVNPKDDLEIPTDAYVSVENIPEEKGTSRRSFLHIPSEIGAYEAEEVGVEHLLRGIRDMTVSTVTDEVQAKLSSLQGLEKRMRTMHEYVDNVIAGKLPVNHKIVYKMQDMFNLCPDLKQAELVRAFAVRTNDQMLVIYLSCIIRSIVALHSLITNKLTNKLFENPEEEEEKDQKDKKEKKDAKDKEKGAKDNDKKDVTAKK